MNKLLRIIFKIITAPFNVYVKFVSKNSNSLGDLNNKNLKDFNSFEENTIFKWKTLTRKEQ